MTLALGIVVFGLIGAIAVYGYSSSNAEAERLGTARKKASNPATPV